MQYIYFFALNCIIKWIGKPVNPTQCCYVMPVGDLERPQQCARCAKSLPLDEILAAVTAASGWVPSWMEAGTADSVAQ